MCPHTSVSHLKVADVVYVHICYICVLILLYMCPHTAIYVSSYLKVANVVYVHIYYRCPHTAIYVSSYLKVADVVFVDIYICVLTQLHMCPNT
jgi:hypothetical protein